MIHKVRPEEKEKMMSLFAQDLIAKGYQEGLRGGETLILLRLLSKRFGSTPEWVPARLAKTDMEILKKWTENILDAKSIDDVFQ
ncbi:MAG: DUF4351 domain-containing protein [Nitrospirae bacterium]|nr:DUF4351 domain-containing protein [Magnetococcales bacterium]HAT49213.1 hypothetical protein [Alphaproteobacteria bacterium]